MENTYSILAFLKDNKAAHHRAMIYLRITVNGQRAELSTKRSIDPTRWDAVANRMRGNKEDSKEVNSFIDTLTIKLNKIYSKLIENSETVTATRVKEIFLGKDVNRKTLLEVFEHHNEMMYSRIGVDFSKATFTRYQTTLDHIKNFNHYKYRHTDIELSRLKYSFITDLEHYFKVVRKCNHNTTLKYIRNLRKIINLAIRNDWLEKDPFKAYRVKLKENKRVFLTSEELTALETKSVFMHRLAKVRDVFVFCCYTGLSYVDVEKLTSRQISSGLDGTLWIFIERTKTGNPSHIPLLPKALDILNKYKNDPEVLMRGKVLPVISNQRINGYLKELAVLCDIDKKLTFHAARHTFATTVTLTNGIPLETVSALLGHRNLKTTQHYARILDKKVCEDMNVLRQRLREN